MKIIKKLSQIFLILIFLTSCKTSLKKDSPIINSEENINANTDSEKKRMEIKFSCGDDGISEYLNDGWIILKEDSQEKICTWKSIPATKDCDMEKDKGCKITTPDKIGEEKIYLLEKQLEIMHKNKEYLIELILKKLKDNKIRKINLNKIEFTNFINSLLNNN